MDDNRIQRSQDTTDDPNMFEELKLHFQTQDRFWHAFLSVYSHLSTLSIRWRTDLIVIPNANDRQIRNLMEDYGQYPKVQAALRNLMEGDSSYLRIVVDDRISSKLGHVIMAYEKKHETRKIAICEFEQCASISILGVLCTFGLSGLAFYYRNATPIQIFLAVCAKLGADYGLSKKDVAIIACIKHLQHAGLLTLNTTTGTFNLGHS
jgi:hypothetical protein